MNTETNPQFHWESFVAELAQQQNDNNTFELNWNELLRETELLALLFERGNNETDL